MKMPLELPAARGLFEFGLEAFAAPCMRTYGQQNGDRLVVKPQVRHGSGIQSAGLQMEEEGRLRVDVNQGLSIMPGDDFLANPPGNGFEARAVFPHQIGRASCRKEGRSAVWAEYEKKEQVRCGGD